MPNILSSLNVTNVNDISQEQITGVMNTHYFMPVLITIMIIIFTFLLLIGLWWNTPKSKVKYYTIIGYAGLITTGLIIICYFFPNTIYQILNSVFNY